MLMQTPQRGLTTISPNHPGLQGLSKTHLARVFAAQSNTTTINIKKTFALIRICQTAMLCLRDGDTLRALTDGEEWLFTMSTMQHSRGIFPADHLSDCPALGHRPARFGQPPVDANHIRYD
jgi:hypothetical protein